MPEILQLPIIKMNHKQYYVVEGMKILRNIEDPNDFIPFDEAFVRIKFTGDYVVLNDPDMIAKARTEIIKDITDIVLDDIVQDFVETEAAPDGHIGMVDDHFLEETK